MAFSTVSKAIMKVVLVGVVVSISTGVAPDTAAIRMLHKHSKCKDCGTDTIEQVKEIKKEKGSIKANEMKSVLNKLFKEEDGSKKKPNT
jgi:formate dehydrogenase assembly factor FdhD